MGLSINNVSMDYFLRGVDAAKPKNAPPAAAPAQVNENLPVDTRRPASTAWSGSAGAMRRATFPCRP